MWCNSPQAGSSADSIKYAHNADNMRISATVAHRGSRDDPPSDQTPWQHPPVVEGSNPSARSKIYQQNQVLKTILLSGFLLPTGVLSRAKPTMEPHCARTQSRDWGGSRPADRR